MNIITRARHVVIRRLRPLQGFCGARWSQLKLSELSDPELHEACNAIPHEAYKQAIHTLSALPALSNSPNTVGVRPENLRELAEIAHKVERHYVRVLQLFAENTLWQEGLCGRTVEQLAEASLLSRARIEQILLARATP
jgi:hypothetical protein